MAHVNELAYAALITATGETDGPLAQLKAIWLKSLGYAGNLNEMWIQLFQAEGATEEKFNSAAAEYFASLGYTGDISEMWVQFWEGTLPT